MGIRERIFVWRAVRAIDRTLRESTAKHRRYQTIWTWMPHRAFFRDCVRSFTMRTMAGDCG